MRTSGCFQKGGLSRCRVGVVAALMGMSVLFWSSSKCPEGSIRDKVPAYGIDMDLFWSPAVCTKLARFGAVGDGGWTICADDRVALESSSLVFSFGIRDDDSFDRHINAATGAEVFMFDPTEHVSIDEKAHTKRMTFHRWGLSGWDKPGGEFPYLTLRSIKQKLEMADDRVVDVLKVDIEHNEWASLLQACKAGDLRHVAQLAVEFHLWPQDKPVEEYFADKRDVIRCLGEAGFRFFFFSENGASDYLRGASDQKVRQCFEVAAININLLQSKPFPEVAG